MSAERDRLIVVHGPDLDDELAATSAVAEEALAFLAATADPEMPRPSVHGQGRSAALRCASLRDGLRPPLTAAPGPWLEAP